MCNKKLSFFLKVKTKEKIFKLIENINSNKVTQQFDISVQTSKENSVICSYMLYKNFSNPLLSKRYSDSLKKVEITPIFKKDKKCIKNN